MNFEFINCIVNYFCSIFSQIACVWHVWLYITTLLWSLPFFSVFLMNFTYCTYITLSSSKVSRELWKSAIVSTKVHLSSTKFLWLHRLLAKWCDVALRPWRSKCSNATDMAHLKGSEKPFRPAGIIWGEKTIKLRVMQFVSSSRRVHPSFSSLLPSLALMVSCNLSTHVASLSLVLIFI